jgi:hypothetical protein
MKFHFNFRQGHAYQVDDDGSEFGDAEEAYLGAFRAAQDMWHELLVQRQDPTLCAFDVTDAKGNQLFLLPFGEILDVCQGRMAQAAPSGPLYELGRAAENRRKALHIVSQVAESLREARATLTETRALLAQVDKMSGH